MKKRVVSILLAIVLVWALTLVGCGNSQGSGQKSDTASTSNNEKVEFTWVHHMEEEGKKDWVNNCVKVYMEKHPNVKINVEMIPNDNFLTVLKTRIAANDAPTIFDLDRVNTIDFQKAGHLAKISDVEELKKNFSSDILAQGQIDGVQYGVPLDVSAYGVFYNKDVFKQYGLEIPKTADEFKKICQTLKDNGVQPLGAAFGESWCQKHFCYAYTYIDCVENNANWFSQKMSLKNNFSNDTEFKKAMTDMASYKEYWGNDAFSTSWNNVLSGIATGKIAMTINGSWTIAGILGINPKANIGTFALPVSNDLSQTQMRFEPGNNFCIYNTDDSKLLTAAEDFYKYLCSEDSAKYYATVANTLTGCNVNVKTISSIDDIKAYKDKQVYNMIAITEFNSEYLSSFNDVTTKYLQKDTFDANAYAKALDNTFTAIK